MTTAGAAAAIFLALVLIALLIRHLPWFRAPIRSALGEVRGHKAEGGESGNTYRMIIEFADETGRDHIFIDGMHHNTPWLPKDAVVEVFYPAADPTWRGRRRRFSADGSTSLLCYSSSLWAQLPRASRPPG